MNDHRQIDTFFLITTRIIIIPFLSIMKVIKQEKSILATNIQVYIQRLQLKKY